MDGSRTVVDLRKDLAECKAELPRMKNLRDELDRFAKDDKNLEDPLSNVIRKYRDVLQKDVENYAHMLEEAKDLEKSWANLRAEIL